MRFDTSQQMKMSQQMKLAPRMIQSMEILQMPVQQLEERIEQELEGNVTLETYEPTGDLHELRAEREQAERDDRENERELNIDETGSSADDFERLEAMESQYGEDLVTEYDASPRDRFDDLGSTLRRSTRLDGERDGKLDAMANTEGRPESLADQLLEQWAFVDAEPDIAEAGALIIGYIEDDGYLRTELGALAALGPKDADGNPRFDEVTLERALDELQHTLEPAGIGARDTTECLLLQIDALIEQGGPGAVDEWADARELIANHLDDLIHNRVPKVARASGLSVDAIGAATAKMRRLVISPGRMLIDDAPPAIVPDAIVEYDDDTDSYEAFLTDGRLPNLRVNREYARMVKDRSLPKADRDFVKTNLSNAQWLIDAVEQRQQTLLRVIRAVVAAQRDFFDSGPQALKPLPMTQVAEQLGVHVATVSRAVAGKHLQTPRGVFPLRKFFTGGTQTESGEDVSWDTIKAALRDVIDTEDKSKPLSDEAIVKALKSRGIDIARRTVAKYRGQLNIPSARMRKKF
jgi:RNA polymerase sigma-54 factor